MLVGGCCLTWHLEPGRFSRARLRFPFFFLLLSKLVLVIMPFLNIGWSGKTEACFPAPERCQRHDDGLERGHHDGVSGSFHCHHHHIRCRNYGWVAMSHNVAISPDQTHKVNSCIKSSTTFVRLETPQHQPDMNHLHGPEASSAIQGPLLNQLLIKFGLQELGHRYILTQPLAAPCLEHKIPCGA